MEYTINNTTMSKEQARDLLFKQIKTQGRNKLTTRLNRIRSLNLLASYGIHRDNKSPCPCDSCEQGQPTNFTEVV